MTSRFQPGCDWDKYDTLVAEAIDAFSVDVNYLINILESARSLSSKKKGAARKNATLKE